MFTIAQEEEGRAAQKVHWSLDRTRVEHLIEYRESSISKCHRKRDYEFDNLSMRISRFRIFTKTSKFEFTNRIKSMMSILIRTTINR